MGKSLSRLLATALREAPLPLLVLFVLSLLGAAAAIGQVWLLGRGVNAVANNFFEGGGAGAIFFWVGSERLVSMLAGGTALIQSLLGTFAQQRITFRFESALLAKAQRVPLESFEEVRFHDDLQRARGSIGPAVDGVVAQLSAMLLSGVAALGYLWLLARVHLLLIPLVMAISLPTLWLDLRQRYARYDLRREYVPLTRKAQVLSGLLTDRTAAKEIRLAGVALRLHGWWADAYWQGLRARLQLNVQQQGAQTILGLLVQGASLATTFFLVWLSGRGLITVGDYVTMGLAIAGAQTRLAGSSQAAAGLYESLLASSDLFAFLDLPERAETAAVQHLPERLRTGIQMKDVSFTYPGAERPALVQVSLAIRPGERIALVGENGAGKSTLVKVLLGLYRPTAGEILYEGIPADALGGREILDRTSAVFQEFIRYPFSLRENIALGAVERSEDEEAIRRAAAIGGVDRFVGQLPSGYETVLGNLLAAGTDLSEGQWQRVALSRAGMRDADWLILDEPTAALDPQAEESLLRQFLQAAVGRTTLVVTHRLGICREVDRIIVLRQGRVVEDGSHAELLRAGGEYGQLFQAQARWYLPDDGESTAAPASKAVGE